MKLLRFIGNGDGIIDAPVLHLGAAIGSDYTLCGITLDGDTETAGAFEVVDSLSVTCPDCVAIIKHCRGVRVNEERRKK